MTTTVLVISGSERHGSWNKKLQAVALARLREAGCEPRPFDLRALALPLYDGDLEAASGAPTGATALLDALRASDALLIVTPEYNGFPTPLVINAFDWLSRVSAHGDRPAGLAATANKPVGLLAASPGPLGALRSMNFLRQYLQMAFAMIVVPQQFALGRAGDAFDAAGALKDPKALQSVDNVVHALATLAQALQTR
jgi:NAD(P)H-dependent FMN reductase